MNAPNDRPIDPLTNQPDPMPSNEGPHKSDPLTACIFSSSGGPIGGRVCIEITTKTPIQGQEKLKAFENEVKRKIERSGEDLELAALRDEVARLRTERDCVLATRKVWPFHVREAIRRRDLSACAELAEGDEKFVADLQAARDGARSEVERLKAKLAEWQRMLASTCLCTACAAKFEELSGEQYGKLELERIREQMRAFRQLVAERDGAQAEATAAKRERDALRASLRDRPVGWLGLAVAEEREACAKDAHDYIRDWTCPSCDRDTGQNLAFEVEKSIRMRGGQ